VVNIGSVGLPFDGHPRASYALVHLQAGGEYRIEFRRVAYEVEAVVAQLRAVNHPAAVVQAHNLRTALPLSPSLIYTSEMRLGHVLATPKPYPPLNPSAIPPALALASA
jgi:hypothetical protein